MALTEAQKRAQKKYNEANKEKRDRLRLRNATWKFIKNYAAEDDIKEIDKMIETRGSLLKIIDLKEKIERAKHEFPQIIIYDNKAAITKVLHESIIEEEEDMDDFNKWIDGMIGRFDDTQTIIEIDLGNGEPRYFAADEWADIDEYTN